jgi:hypothetical protein
VGYRAAKKCGRFILFANTLILASSSIRQRRVACSFFMVLILGLFISVSPYRYVMQILRAGKWDFRFFTLSGCDGADAGFQQ